MWAEDYDTGIIRLDKSMIDPENIVTTDSEAEKRSHVNIISRVKAKSLMEQRQSSQFSPIKEVAEYSQEVAFSDNSGTCTVEPLFTKTDSSRRSSAGLSRGGEKTPTSTAGERKTSNKKDRMGKHRPRLEELRDGIDDPLK